MQTSDRRTNEATSISAVWRRIWTRISAGTTEIGHGGGGEPSTGDGAAGISNEENDKISWMTVDAVEPSREWCAVFGTVTAALVGFGSLVFALDEGGGKCLSL